MVLGWPLARAEAALKEAGYAVQLEEIRSRKGVEGGEKRVVRQQERIGERCMLLGWSAFQTDVEG